MGFLSGLFASGAKDIVSSVGDAIDKVVTSDEERLKLKNELVQIEKNAEHKAEELSIQADKEITERWKSDNENWITRLIRPLSYAWVIFLFTLIVMFDGNIGEFSINPPYIPVIEGLLTTMTIAYFGSRGVEKGIRYWKGRNNENT